jgi:hypothetical protein
MEIAVIRTGILMQTHALSTKAKSNLDEDFRSAMSRSAPPIKEEHSMPIQYKFSYILHPIIIWVEYSASNDVESTVAEAESALIVVESSLIVESTLIDV